MQVQVHPRRHHSLRVRTVRVLQTGTRPREIGYGIISKTTQFRKRPRSPMSLFLLASGALATFVYFSYSKTPYLEARGKQTDNPIKDVTTFVSHYTEPDDGWSNPNNIT